MDNFETNFQLKALVIEKLKEVDNCENYAKGEYESCLLMDIREQLIDIIKCIPPWFTDSYDQVENQNIYFLDSSLSQCGPFNLTEEAKAAIFVLLFDISADISRRYLQLISLFEACYEDDGKYGGNKVKEVRNL